MTNALIQAINYPLESLIDFGLQMYIFLASFPLKVFVRLSAHVQGAGSDGDPRLGLSASLLAPDVARDPGDHEDHQLHLPQECQGEAFY